VKYGLEAREFGEKPELFCQKPGQPRLFKEINLGDVPPWEQLILTVFTNDEYSVGANIGFASSRSRIAFHSRI
jgi:hypothetical protein